VLALVAVTVGVRLVGGGLGFAAGLTVLVLAPELYLPLRNLAAQYHASADGRAVADLATCDAAAWRRHIAWLPQRPTLFRGTVADNIRLGDRSADDGRVGRAAELAGVAEFARELPNGYATVVGDGGRPLSSGQARRIALARAFLRDAPLVIHDEPTSHLDADAADVVGEAVERLREGRTILLIAHREDLVRRADRIVMLEAGRIVANARAA